MKKNKENEELESESVIVKDKTRFDSGEKIAKFLLDHISRYKVAFSYVHSFGGYPGGRSETFFNEGDAKGTLNYAIVHTIEFFDKDPKRERSEKTIIGAFKKIAKNEMIDVYNKEYSRKCRTIVSEGKQVPPSFKNSDDEKLSNEEGSSSDLMYKKEIIKKFNNAVASLDQTERRVIRMKMEGCSDEEMATILEITDREVKTTLIRAKMKISKDKELEALCA
jgi:RNA polymerase sigma factor (sigma-70 family)